ncbi:carbohydrate ABC transporter permease [Sphaerisporangium sp. TRM90804]|uniref:carbohydrate ABC transporter permease n=1 Tax=Sphaerisporangium sp. TRM90804 TaxID=3031113 RepID=UPI00244C6868|nr:carbohydrate ABC transporter permease [Sphaerisporangium sp. TRM90804]MDH2427126.1 carbohydrate ABC transporter permease [Sphaerisporangium sp. TRM90804]
MRVRTAVLYTALTVGLVAVAGPFLWTVLGSFKPDAEIRRDPPTFLPAEWIGGNYAALFERMDVVTVTINSVVVASVVVASNLLFCSLVAYALTKLDFAGGRLVFGLVLLQMMVPGIVLLIPQFVTIASLNLADTYAGIVLPGLVTPLGVFMMRQFMADIPDELVQAARVDGSGEFRIFFQIVMPLCKPVLATLGLITFMGSWNAFLWPAVVAQHKEMYTLPVALASLSGRDSVHYGMLLAGVVVVITPVLLLFVALQRYFVQGVATAGLK